MHHLSVAQAADACVRHAIPAIGLWRDQVAEAGLARTAATARAAGLHVSSLCRGGFFTHADPAARAAALADNRAASARPRSWRRTPGPGLRRAGAGQPRSGLARRMIADAIADLVPSRRTLGVRLAIEALIRCSAPTGASSPGSARPSTWPASSRPRPSASSWTPTTSGGTRAGRADIASGSRGSPATSCATGSCRCPRTRCSAAATRRRRASTSARSRRQVAAAGYAGYVEVEIFNAAIWDAPPDDTAATVRRRFAELAG